MSDKIYNEILRGIASMFKEYSKTYNATAQKKYNEKRREAVLVQMRERYKTDPVFRQTQIERAKKWNKVFKE